MPVFSAKDFADHEQVVFGCHPESGLKAIIAIHNRNRGPALGGCRMWPYPSDDEALRDVLRLSRGMTYKSAMANLDLGGGKSVIIGNPRTQKTEALLHAMARFVDSLGGTYIAAEDSGIGIADTRIMRKVTAHVTGFEETKGEKGVRTGDPSPSTAYGVFAGIRAAVKFALGRSDLQGLKVAVQGMGNVGFGLASHLKQAGASLWVSDIHEDQVQRAVDQLGATAVPSEEIYGLDVDVFAPCAMGAIINDQTIPQLKARVIAGAANNQLAEARHGEALMGHGILYAPDYVINAGGIIDVYHQRIGFVHEKMQKHVGGIHDTLMEIFERASDEERPTQEVADAIAEERFRVKASSGAGEPAR